MSWSSQELPSLAPPRLLTPLVPEVDYENCDLPLSAYEFARVAEPAHEVLTARMREELSK